MDKMEGFISENNPKNEYHKTLLEVEHLEDGLKEKCYVYFYNKDIDDKFKNEAEFSRLEKLLEEKQNNLRKAEKELKKAKLKATTAKTTSRVLGKVYEE